MSENYIVINGKRAELTEEQMKALGIEVKKDPFARVKSGEIYYWISGGGSVHAERESDAPMDGKLLIVANYCTDKALMGQRALHETLNRLLWRYSMQHDGEKMDWDNPDVSKYKIVFLHDNSSFCIDANQYRQDVCEIYFYSKETAEAAIEEVVKPFMEQHPEFKW